MKVNVGSPTSEAVPVDFFPTKKLEFSSSDYKMECTITPELSSCLVGNLDEVCFLSLNEKNPIKHGNIYFMATGCFFRMAVCPKLKKIIYKTFAVWFCFTEI